ncbi:Gp138 family membrane-puncturing spike protein [Cupriavidus basilensis]
MDRRERVDDPEIALREALDGLRAGLWTALPGIIQSFSGGGDFPLTCAVQAAIKVLVRHQDGAIVSTALPLLVDCPVYFPSGGSCTLTFPVAAGDRCLVVFASRCIDAWWQSGGVQEQAEVRTHDLSDGFAFVGFRSKPRALSSVSTTATQLRSDDGSTYIEMNPGLQKVKIVAPGGFDVVAPLSTFSAAVTVTGMLTFVGGMIGSAVSGAAAVFNGVFNMLGEMWANGKRVDDTHTHEEVKRGTDTSGPVT